jgi:hypothetical protein
MKEVRRVEFSNSCGLSPLVGLTSFIMLIALNLSAMVYLPRSIYRILKIPQITQ